MEEQLFERVVKAIDMVGKDLSYNNANRIPMVLRRQRKSQLTLGNNMPSELLQPSMVSDRYTEFEIHEKLALAFKSNQVPPTRFEFAITNTFNLISYEMQSPRFLELLNDTANNRAFNYPLEQPVGSWGEGLPSFEGGYCIYRHS